MEYSEPLSGRDIYDYAMSQYNDFGDMEIELEFLDMETGEVDEIASMAMDADPEKTFGLEQFIASLSDNLMNSDTTYLFEDESGEVFLCVNVRVDLLDLETHEYVFVMECVAVEDDYEEGNDDGEISDSTN